MLAEALGRIARKGLRHLAVGHFETAQQFPHPARTELDGGHPQRRVTVEETVGDENGEGVEVGEPGRDGQDPPTQKTTSEPELQGQTRAHGEAA